MRKIGEQWVEKDGHMYKAVKKGSCDQNICSWAGLHVDKGLVVIDLGILNEDGCLPSSWGGYPEVIRVGKPNFVTYFRVSLVVKYSDGSGIQVHVTGKTRQEAIDAWNRRA